MTGDRGTSIVELMVSIILLAVGLLGAASMTVAAGRATSRTSLLDRGVWAAQEVLDSLAATPGSGNGVREIGPLTLRWTVTSDGPLDRVVLVVEAPRGAPLELVGTLERRRP